LPGLVRLATRLDKLHWSLAEGNLAEVLLVIGVVEVVRLLMGVQVALLVEALVAVWVGTAEGLLASVDAQVGLEVEVQRKLLVANVALVWLFARVHQHVALQFRVVQKPFVAAIKRALEQFIAVNSHVFLQTCSVVKNFGAGLKVTLENAGVRGSQTGAGLAGESYPLA